MLHGCGRGVGADVELQGGGDVFVSHHARDRLVVITDREGPRPYLSSSQTGVSPGPSPRPPSFGAKSRERSGLDADPYRLGSAADRSCDVAGRGWVEIQIIKPCCRG